MFSTQQQHALAAPLDRANVQYRNQSNRSFSYLEGWHVIAEAIASLVLMAGSVKRLN